MHDAVFNVVVLWTTKAAKLEEAAVETEEREWTHSCGFLAPLTRIFDNFDPTSFKRTNISMKSENRESSEKRELPATYGKEKREKSN